MRDFKKQKQKFMEFIRDCVSGAVSITKKVVKKSFFENLDTCIVQWVKEKRSEGIPISMILQTKTKYKLLKLLKLFLMLMDFKNINEENVENLMNENKNEKGYKMLSNQGIMDAVSGKQSEGDEREQDAT